MRESQLHIIHDYLSNLKVSLILADYIHCDQTWNYFDFTPEFSKFYYICEGEGLLRIGAASLSPTPGQLVFSPAGSIQSISTISENTYKKYWCHFNITSGDVNLFELIKLPFTIDVQDKAKMESCFKKLIHCSKNPSLLSTISSKSILLDIFSTFIDHIAEQDIQLLNSNTNVKLKAAIDYIHMNLDRTITVEQLAQLVNLHPNYFLKLFRTHIGFSPIHYINNLKIDKAKHLLITSELLVSEIADVTGFSSLYHFSRAFKRYSGLSPTEFRQTSRS